MMKLVRRISRFHSTAALALLMVAAAFAGHSTASAQLVYGIGGTDTGPGPNAAAYSLFSFNAATPGTTTTLGTVNTTAGYVLESIAIQPSNGQLFGFEFNSSTNSGQLATINKLNGTLTTVGAPFMIGSISGNSGSSAAISFNPTNGALRLDTGTFGNYRINPATGAIIAQDQPLQYNTGDPSAGKTYQISTIAYQQASPTTLYGIDYVNNTLVTQNITAGMVDPSGRLTTVGPLGITATQGPGSQGVTIGVNGVLYLSTSIDADTAVQDRFYTVNLATGAVSGGTLIGGSATFNTVDIAVLVPEPGTWAAMLFGGALLVVVMNRRRTNPAI